MNYVSDTDDAPSTSVPRRFPWGTWLAAGSGAVMWLCFFGVIRSPLTGEGNSEILYALWAVGGLMASVVVFLIERQWTSRGARVAGFILALLLYGSPLVILACLLVLLLGYRPAPGG